MLKHIYYIYHGVLENALNLCCEIRARELGGESIDEEQPCRGDSLNLCWRFFNVNGVFVHKSIDMCLQA
jgi:hypothetical protein